MADTPTSAKKEPELPPIVQTAWMNPTARAWLAAARPWSAPASLIPISLAGAVLWRTEGSNLLTVDFALTLVGGLLVHLAANLANTYYDFKNGVDTKERSDDRALVDGHVSPSNVAAMAMGCLTCAGGILVYFLTIHGSTLASLALFGLVLALFYSADPIGLKYHGLGDVVVFLCFGPLLMEGTSLLVCGRFQLSVLAYSVPIGLLTTAILHANNTRDMVPDKASGAITLALTLGFRRSYDLYCVLLATVYACCFINAIAFGLGYRVFFIVTTVPWALYLTRAFKARHLAELPQMTAQFECFFGTVLICSLADPMFLARFLLGCLFYLGGVNNILMWSYVSPMLSEDIGNTLGLALPQGAVPVLLGGAVVGQLCASLLFILGIYTKVAAALLLMFLLPVTLVVHDFWTIGNAEHDGGGPDREKFRAVVRRAIPTFPTEFDAEFVHFFKNVGMMGGLVLFLECGCA